MKTKSILTLFALLMTVSASAQLKQFSLEDLNFGGTNYYNMVPKNKSLTWWGDQLVRLDTKACYLVDAKTQKETVLFTLEDVEAIVTGDAHGKVRSLRNASFPYANDPVVRLVAGKQHLLINWEKRMTVGAMVIDGEHVDWNSASMATAYVKDYNLFVRAASGRISQLSTDGSREIVYGQSVHRNEFGIDGGTFWSPDGNRLAFYRMDQSMVTDYPQVNLFDRIAGHEPDKYPMAGETSHKVTVGVFDVNTQKTVYLKAGDPTDRYFTNIAWSPDAKLVYMFELNRDQNDCRLVSYNAETGDRVAELYRETHPKYVEPSNPIVFLPWDNTKFIMQSEKDGYNHLYLFDTEGNELQQLTSGNFVVMEVMGFNAKQKSIIIATNELNPLQRNIYSLNLKTLKRTLLDSGEGYHNGRLSASGTRVIDSYSTPDQPRLIDLVDVVKAQHTNYFVADDPWAGYAVPEYSNGSIKAADGQTDLYYRMVKPVGFDPNKKYPTVIYVYGGPHAHNVQASWHWGSRSWETYMAQKGYVLFILDNRGSENRGREFEQATFRQLGQIEMADQMEGVKFLQSLPYVDKDRMGVHGWSFGGFMTMTLMLNHPEVFKVGVAGGPVVDWKWYEVMYGERYMDTPQSNPEGYEKSSLINKAKNLKGKLQIIIGMNDPTCVPQHSLMFLNACSEAGTQPDFFAYPGEGHNMRGHKSVHLHERITQYFEEHLK